MDGNPRFEKHCPKEKKDIAVYSASFGGIYYSMANKNMENYPEKQGHCKDIMHQLTDIKTIFKILVYNYRVNSQDTLTICVLMPNI